MLVSDFMTKSPVTISEDTLVKDAAKLMVENRVSVLPVVNSANELVGIITESDFIGKEIKVPHALASIKQLFNETFYFRDIETLYEEAKEKPAKSVMSTHVKSIPSDATLDDLTNLMMKKNLKRIPVSENGKLVGIITRKDVIKAFTR